MASSKIIDKDLGFDRITREISQVSKNKAAVYVGIHGKSGSELVLRGAVNEFGSADGRIPERSFLRSTIDENVTEYTVELAKVVNDAITGKTTMKRGLSLLGERVVGDIKVKIREIRTPANAPMTIKLKGADNPLIDTGQMRNSIGYEVK